VYGADVARNGVANGFHSRTPEWRAAGIAAGPGGSAMSMTVACGSALQTTEDAWSTVPGAGLQQPQPAPAPDAASGAARAGMRPKVVHHSSKSDGRMARHRTPRGLAVRCFIEKFVPGYRIPGHHRPVAFVRHYTCREFHPTAQSGRSLCRCSHLD